MRAKTRSLELLGVAMVAVLAISAITAGAASARTWRVAGAVLVGNESVSCKINAGSFELESEVGGIPVVIAATGVECLSGAKIFNSGTGQGAVTLKFTGVTVVQPAKCSITGGTITTNPLKTQLTEIAGVKESFNLVQPVTGTELVTITLSGGTCVVAGNYPLKGKIAGEGNNWGTEVVEQPLSFSLPIDIKTGFGLTFGGAPAILEGTTLLRLSGANTGKVFGGG
jgi:hypothetical protein